MALMLVANMLLSLDITNAYEFVNEVESSHSEIIPYVSQIFYKTCFTYKIIG